jgi:Helix-turn-helix domain
MTSYSSLQSITLQSFYSLPRDEPRGGPVSSQVHPGRPGLALGHPLRVALLGLLAHRATLTSTEAARELGESSGACSFHLRQLARYGHVEEVPGARGRARPWRLATAEPEGGGEPEGSGEPEGGGPAGGGDDFGALARELENEGYRRWLSHRAAAPPGWRDEAFSTVLHLTPEELTEVAAAIRGVIAAYAGRPGPDPGPGAGGGGGAAGVLPVAVVARMFPLLPAGPDPAAPGGAAGRGA